LTSGATRNEEEVSEMATPPPVGNIYNNVSIHVEPQILGQAYVQASAAVADIANYLQAIDQTLTSLRLSWDGQSSDEMKAIIDRWNEALTLLFGTKSDPEAGAMNVYLSGLAAASENYTNAELSVEGMFDQFRRGFGSSGGGGGGGGGQTVLDNPTGPISNPGGAAEYIFHTTNVNERF
jgi:Proteins of 100 residues with WXG